MPTRCTYGLRDIAYRFPRLSSAWKVGRFCARKTAVNYISRIHVARIAERIICFV